ncbi:ProQ/FinO family protein [Endozoicomonas arenosclerae]|uniref:ProQ/FinO family protein n=1 Tax=Endozoicomonas arenosclerae TaxID=1633495 RepID=UPI000783EF6A|nr:ProQ/FinO family protein [Endozoicomonas arenosclerae]
MQYKCTEQTSQAISHEQNMPNAEREDLNNLSSDTQCEILTPSDEQSSDATPANSDEISSSEALKLIRERWPEAFRVASPKPLKVGIHNEMKQTGEFPVSTIKKALKLFTQQDRYLLCIKEGRNRVDLNGKSSGKVKLKEAVNAEILLYQRQLTRQKKNERVFVGQLKLVTEQSAQAQPAGDSANTETTTTQE